MLGSEVEGEPDRRPDTCLVRRRPTGYDDVMSPGAVHRSATAFSDAAAVYEQARPGYPPEALAWLDQQLGLGPGRRVLDLAAGTGKLTRELLARGATVVAVEPVEGMRRTLATAVPGAVVVAGVAQAIPLGTATVDAMTVAQALHWFAMPQAVGEMHRVLRPGSRLAVVWNRRDLADPLQADLHRLMAPLQGDTPSGTSGEWRRVLAAERARRRPRGHRRRTVLRARGAIRGAVETAHRRRGCGAAGGLGEFRGRLGERRARAVPGARAHRSPALPASTHAALHHGDLHLPACRLTNVVGRRAAMTEYGRRVHPRRTVRYVQMRVCEYVAMPPGNATIQP